MADNYEEEIKTAPESNDLAREAEMAQINLDEFKSVTLTIGITGESGSGKSTLVNALRGIRNNTEGAAPTGARVSTMEPTEYIHPENPNIRIWDLPGISSPNFKADKYLKDVGFEKYDLFIIVSSERFSENEAKLAQEIQRMKKKFYYVRSKIDHNIRDEREADPNFNEEDILNFVRDHCTEELRDLGVQSPKVFVVSGLRPDLYEFRDLWRTLQEELPEHQKNFLFQTPGIIMTDQCEKEVKAALENNDLPLAAEKALKYLGMLNSAPVTIGITGQSGSGKSTLVNALRGIKNQTEGAAPTDIVETTMEPTEYIHPENPNIRIWDLPGIGTNTFTAAKYLKYVGFEKYDFFIIVSSERFSENDAKLAQEIRRMKKKFYFVRSKVDNDVHDERMCDSSITEEDVLNRVKNSCSKELQKLGVESPKVFLVSGLNVHRYEFKDLWKTLEEKLPKLLRDALLLALPNISLDVIEQKKKTLGNKIIWFTFASTVVAAVPVPGLSEGVDLGMMVKFTKHCVISLGLTPESLQRLSAVSGVSVENLRAEIKSPLGGVEISRDLVFKVLTRFAVVIAAMTLEEGVRFIPFGIGIPVAMAISGVTTYKALSYILNSLTEDAQRVFIKAVGSNTAV